jgi:hypothetical protein
MRNAARFPDQNTPVGGRPTACSNLQSEHHPRLPLMSGRRFALAEVRIFLSSVSLVQIVIFTTNGEQEIVAGFAGT